MCIIVIARDSVVCHMIVMSTNQIVTCSFCVCALSINGCVYASLFSVLSAAILNQVIL